MAVYVGRILTDINGNNIGEAYQKYCKETERMPKNTMKPYGRNIPEQSGTTQINENVGRFNKTTQDIEKPSKKKNKDK